jgi:LPS export ABC transporter permease LptF/LPS export ABC transporter permease LptG
MKRFSWSVAKYILQAILPYFIFSWLLLSVILFVQQASRYSEIFFSVSIPKNLVWQLTLALIPNVIAFTCPMAALIGVIIGLSKMQGDSELTAIRTAGIGNFQISLPVIFLGIILSLFTFGINLYGVPFAAQLVRKVALQTALYKLESPIEPGVFNTEVNGYTIYVKDTDFNNGTWKNIFIYNEDKQNNSSRLITSRSGRIDTNGETSELWLENAIITTFSAENNQPKFASENVGQIRFGIKTKRDEIVGKISKTEKTPEELGLAELANYARSKEGKEKTEAQILWQRRILLSVTPLIFALLGTALILRFNRSGRGFGVFLALVSLVAYYLITLLGEQLARTNQIGVLSASLIPVGISLIFIVWFYLSNRYLSNQSKLQFRLGKKFLKLPFKFNGFSRSARIGLTRRILDFDVVLNLLKYFLLTLSFLTAIYLIFTAFELWKFAGEISNGFILLINYLIFLLPFIYIQLAPSALMIATLATFVIKSRQNEIVTWTAAGQSVYRLLLPCFILMIGIGFLNWGIQEKVLTATNKIQDDLRSQIRSRGIMANKEGKYWVANDRRIYSFELDSGKSEKDQKINNLTVYEFSASEPKLQAIYKTQKAIWEREKIKFPNATEKVILVDGRADISQVTNFELAESSNPFNDLYQKPNHLNTKEIKEQINDSESETERKNYEVALEKRYATPLLPFIVTLFTAPFALSLSRKGKVITVGYAVGFWLLFMGITSTFEQFGLNGYISPGIAVWSPLMLFSLVGAFLLSKVRT